MKNSDLDVSSLSDIVLSARRVVAGFVLKLPDWMRGVAICVAGVFFAVVFSLITLTTAHAFPATQCAADRYGNDLVCTANDVSITGISVVGDTTSCIGGANVTLDLKLTVNFATPDRYDIGIFLPNDGKAPWTQAANGGAASCSVSVLPNSSPFLDLDGPADTCGDGNRSIGGGTGSGIHYMSNVTVPCQSVAGAGGNLYIPFVSTWDNQASPAGGMCNSNLDALPGGPSKCNAPTIIQGSIAVVVLPAIVNSDGITTIFSGSSTDYTITITNTTGASLSGALFKDPAVAGIAANSVSCAAAGGASCPSSTVAAMQGAGITIPVMPAGSSVTFTVNATLTGSPGDTRTNTATVSVGSQSNTASDTDTIVEAIAILPTSLAQNGDKGSAINYSYTVYNFGPSADTISLSVASSRGWTVTRSPASVSVPAGGSAVVTVTVNIPSGAVVGDVDTTTLTAVSGNNPGKTATARAVTTVTTILTLTPSNTSAGGMGSYVYYTHRVQSNASTSKSVSLTPAFTAGTCTGWTSSLFESDKTTPLASTVTLAANGGYKDFVLKVSIPASAVVASTCTVTLSAAYTSGTANTVSVTDVTTVKNLVLYEDPGYSTEQYTYPAGNNVYAKGFGLIAGKSYEYRWYDSSGAEVCAPREASSIGSIFPDTCQIPVAGPLGTWTVQIWNITDNILFRQENFYVGPDHLKASYSGANPVINANSIIDLALHDKTNHVVPVDALGHLVKGSPTDTEGPLMLTVAVSGSAQIVSTTLVNATIVGQTVTGKLDSTYGTATLTITDSIAEIVTVTPASYKGALYGSPTRDEPVSVTFTTGGPDHYELSLPTTGIACLSSTATVTACTDTSSPCINKDTSVSGKTATLAASAGTLAPTTVTFNASGVASAILSYPAAADGAVVSVTLSGEQAAATNPRKCCPGGVSCVAGNSCSTTFNTAGFIFSASAGGGMATIPTQVAGTSSGTYYLRAVKTNTTTKACESALTGANTVNFAYECNNPAACYAANLMSVNGGVSTAIARNNNGSVASYTGVNMTFDGNGNAPFTFNYGDAGMVKLWANKTSGGALLTALSGNSNSFVVKPAGFVLSNIRRTSDNFANPAAASATGVAFVRAGEAFSVNVAAVTSTGGTAYNYGMEAAPEGVKLTSSLVTGLGLSNNPAISGAFGAFANGVASGAAFTWDEAGIITLTPAVGDGSYLGAGDVTGTVSGNVGRFYPDHFDTAVVATSTVPMPCPVGLTCPVLYNGFVYSGQPFSLTVTAKNAGGNPTVNYSAATGFAKTTNLSAWGVPGTTTAPTGAGTLGVSSVTVFAAGTLTEAAEKYTFTTALTAPADIYIRAVDTDGVTSLRSIPANSIEGGVKVVSGRVRISNAYGSELLPLTLTAAVQYYSGTSWADSVTDSATSLTLASSYNLIKSGVTTGTTIPAPTGIATLSGGKLSIVLGKPAGGATGSATINPGTQDYLPLTPGLATFGVYGGRSAFIYRGRHGR